MNWYKKIIKTSSIRYLYHGTSINNLNSILSEGLNSYHGAIYDETFQNVRKKRSLESYGGVYLTDNLRTALMSGFTAAEKNKVETKTSVIAIVQIEDKTPSVLIDEDLLNNPYHAIYQVAGDPSIPIKLVEWITNNFPNIEIAVDFYLQGLSSGRTQINNDKFLQGIKPYVYNLLKTYAIQQLTIAFNNEDWGTTTLKYNYPQLENLPDMTTAIQNFRNAASIFMQKANRLTTFINDSFQNNMRITEPISFRGKNKIVLISTFNRNDKASDYNYSINITYLSNPNILKQYINDIKEKYSDSFNMKHNGNIVYENKKERVLI